MEKITWMNVSNIMTQIADHFNSDNNDPQLEYNLLAPIFIEGTDTEIVAVHTDSQCLIKTPLGSSWVNYTMFNDNIIAVLYKAVCDLWDKMVEESKERQSGKILELNMFLDSRANDVAEFTRDAGISTMIGRDNAKKMLCSVPIEVLAKKYLDACEIIRCTKSILDK
jgi:hypothetical protein